MKGDFEFRFGLAIGAGIVAGIALIVLGAVLNNYRLVPL